MDKKHTQSKGTHVSSIQEHILPAIKFPIEIFSGRCPITF